MAVQKRLGAVFVAALFNESVESAQEFRVNRYADSSRVAHCLSTVLDLLRPGATMSISFESDEIILEKLRERLLA